MSYLGPSLRRTRKRARPWLRALVALGLSLLANAAALRWVAVDGIVGVAPQRPGTPPKAVVLAPLSRREWEANRRAFPAQPPGARAAQPPVVVAPQPPPPTPPPRHVPGQVVDVAPSKNATPPKDSRFLAEHDSTVEKETRSRHQDKRFENAAPKPTSPDAVARAEPPRVAGEDGHGGKAGAKSQRVQPLPQSSAPRPAEGDRARALALRSAPRGDLPQPAPEPGGVGVQGPLTPGGATPPAPGAQGEERVDGAPGKPGSLAALRPTAADYDRLAGGPSPDKLDGVEEGEGTYLNTRSWKYASYFNRIKRAVSNTWDPSSAFSARDPTGTRFGQRDWTTLLAIRLDDQGALKDVAVQRSSGLDFLDTAAVQAFRRAQPFINPPRGLADDKGEIAFSFGFIFEVGHGVRLFGRAPTGD